jgi:hypothetical protein
MYNLLDENEVNSQVQNEPATALPEVERTQMKNVSSPAKSGKKKRELSLKQKRVIGYALITLSILLFISYFLIYVPVVRSYQQAQVVADNFKVLAAYGKDQNIIGIQGQIKPTQESMDKLRKEAKGVAWTKFVPVLGAYYGDFEHGMNAGDAGLKAASKMITVVSPYADLLGLRGKGTFSGSTQDRIAQLVVTMDKIIPELDAIKPELTIVKDEMNKISPNRYAFSPRVQTGLTSAIETANGVEKLLNDAKPFLSQLPNFLGRDKPTKYLIIFQNDKELRATGGFITAFARLTVDKGRVINSDSSDIYKIDEKLPIKVTPPEPILKYLPEPNGKTKTHWQTRDSNFFPDYKESAEKFEEFYKHVKPVDWDGVIAVDTYVVQGILQVLGAVEVDGVKFTSDIDKRCNCPQVVYELESFAEKSASGNAERKALIGDLMQEILLQSFKQEDKIPGLANEAIKLMTQKHVLVYMHDTAMQKTVEDMDWAGRIASSDNPTRFGYSESDWDYWHWNESNFAGAKANLYIQQTSEHSYDVAGDGTIIKTVNVTISNPQKNDYWLNGRYRAYFRAYVPKGSELIDSKGSRDQVNVFTQYGKTVFDGFYELTPKQDPPIKIMLKYRLPFKKKKGDTYTALFQKQPGTTQFQYILKGLGSEQKFDLSEDRKIEIKL